MLWTEKSEVTGEEHKHLLSILCAVGSLLSTLYLFFTLIVPPKQQHHGVPQSKEKHALEADVQNANF